MFPALVRYDECERGVVEHALRLIVAKTRRQYNYPATHYASTIPATSVDYPAMGQRLRLKASFVIPEHWTKAEKAVLRALKKYGAIVADNGGFFSISVAPDDRFATNAFSNLATIDINNFEVIQTTGPNDGPRSPGAISVNAGADRTVLFGTQAGLVGTSDAPAGTAAIQWARYSGPGNVTFADASQLQTTASFSAPGTYTLRLSAANGLHPVAYDAVIVRVQPRVGITVENQDVVIRFDTASGQRYRVEAASALTSGNWTPVAAEIVGTGVPISVIDANAATAANRFYRVVDL
jgi:hypothetical protein